MDCKIQSPKKQAVKMNKFEYINDACLCKPTKCTNCSNGNEFSAIWILHFLFVRHIISKEFMPISRKDDGSGKLFLQKP